MLLLKSSWHMLPWATCNMQRSTIALWNTQYNTKNRLRYDSIQSINLKETDGPFFASTYDIQAVGKWDSKKLRVLSLNRTTGQQSMPCYQEARKRAGLRIRLDALVRVSYCCSILGVIRFWYQGKGIVYDKQGSAKMTCHPCSERGWFASS